jgi:hypothetical protein
MREYLLSFKNTMGWFKKKLNNASSIAEII